MSSPGESRGGISAPDSGMQRGAGRRRTVEDSHLPVGPQHRASGRVLVLQLRPRQAGAPKVALRRGCDGGRDELEDAGGGPCHVTCHVAARGGERHRRVGHAIRPHHHRGAEKRSRCRRRSRRRRRRQRRRRRRRRRRRGARGARSARRRAMRVAEERQRGGGEPQHVADLVQHNQQQRPHCVRQRLGRRRAGRGSARRPGGGGGGRDRRQDGERTNVEEAADGAVKLVSLTVLRICCGLGWASGWGAWAQPWGRAGEWL